jgi:hypothetical protein
MQLPDTLRSETERLQSEIKELKERLNNTERLLHKESIQDIKVSTHFPLCNNELCSIRLVYKKQSSDKVQISDFTNSYFDCCGKNKLLHLPTGGVFASVKHSIFIKLIS